MSPLRWHALAQCCCSCRSALARIVLRNSTQIERWHFEGAVGQTGKVGRWMFFDKPPCLFCTQCLLRTPCELYVRGSRHTSVAHVRTRLIIMIIMDIWHVLTCRSCRRCRARPQAAGRNRGRVLRHRAAGGAQPQQRPAHAAARIRLRRHSHGAQCALCLLWDLTLYRASPWSHMPCPILLVCSCHILFGQLC